MYLQFNGCSLTDREGAVEDQIIVIEIDFRKGYYNFQNGKKSIRMKMEVYTPKEIKLKTRKSSDVSY